MTLRRELVAGDAGSSDSVGVAVAINLVRSLVAGVVIGAMVVVLAVSFSAIIYTGDLAPFLSRGLGLSLTGTTIMLVTGALTVSYRGTLLGPQDATAILLSLAAGSIAAGWAGSDEALFATVVLLTVFATALTGTLLLFAGWVNLGFIVRYVPYPVLGGFLVATGYLLLMGAIGMATGQSVSVWTIARVLEADVAIRWVPWVLYGAVLCAITRSFGHWLVLPGCIVIGVLSFYAALFLTGGDLEFARAADLLLGPFEEGALLQDFTPILLPRADPPAVLAQAPSILAVAGMAIVGALLNASALSVAAEVEIDPNRDLRAVGAANIGAAFAGGLPGYHMLSTTLLARTLGLTSRAAAMAVAAFLVCTVIVGPRFLSVLPVGVFAGVVTLLGLNPLYTWLWVERRRLPLRDFSIVIVILVVAATVGFLEALAVGLLVASMLFIVGYSKLDVVRLRSSAAVLRSRVERPNHELQHLSENGDRALVYLLSGYLFFGTAMRLADEVAHRVREASGKLHFFILDFRRVPGMDASATFALGKLVRGCSSHGVEILFAGLSESMQADLKMSLRHRSAPPQCFDRLDSALRLVEERLLEQSDAGQDLSEGFLEGLVGRADLERYFCQVEVRAGEQVFAQGDQSTSMALVLSGGLKAEIGGLDGAPVLVATIRPGALVGEIGLYAGVPRTARVTADRDSRLLVAQAEDLDALLEAHPKIAAELHRAAAALLARRLMRTSALVRDLES